MALRSLTTAVLGLVMLTSGRTALQGQGNSAWSGCKTDSLSTFNCAKYYSGTLTYASELKTPSGTETLAVTATITAGKVACRLKQSPDPEVQGAGMLVVEHESGGTSGGYNIKVWCPDGSGRPMTRDAHPVIDTYDQEAADYATLAGKDAHEHPSADPANDVTGTETITWSLKR